MGEPGVRASDRMAAGVAEGASERSPDYASPEPANRFTKAFCRNCRTSVGEFYNSWRKITGSYYVPALPASYRSLLKNIGKQKAASKGTDIEGCIIQPLSCPATGCGTPIGFVVVSAPAEKRFYRGRDFFKLSRIDLRCEVSLGNSISVGPLEDASSELLAIEDSASPSPSPTKLSTASTEAMEIDSRLPGTQYQGPHQYRHDEHHAFHRLHQPLQRIEANTKSLPPPSITNSPITPLLKSVPQKAVSIPSLSKSPSIELVHELQPPMREAGAGFTNQPRTLPSIISHPKSNTGATHLINGHHYPRAPQQVQLDAIERLQTQISQNSGALAAQSRDIKQNETSMQRVEENLRQEFQTQLQRQSIDIRRMDDTVGRLYHDMQGIRQAVDGFSREMHAMRGERQAQCTTGLSGQHASAQDSALELMAHQIATISQKANEIDTLKLTIEIMKNKIQRLEGEPSTASHPQPVSQEQSAQTAHPAHTAVSYHAAPVAVLHASPPIHATHRNQPHPSIPTSIAISETSKRPEPQSSQNGWATINAGIKRPHPNDVESPHESPVHTVGSPKRQRTGTNDIGSGHGASQGPPPAQVYGTQIQSQTHTLPSQPHTMTERILVSQSQNPVHAPYGTQDVPSGETWRPESQQVVEHRPRGRPRGSGRGGRGRKSMPAQVHQVGPSDWESNSWQEVSGSQMSPEGHHNHMTPSGKGIARRGNGGGGRGGYTPDRATSLGLQGVTASMGTASPDEFFGSMKKSRSKPIRNADGVLIRKDGRPDMRSQSSAANLRKVNAKKDDITFGSFQDSSSTTPNTPSPGGHIQPELDAVSKKHNEIMGRMFPRGMAESRKDHDYARQLFEDEGRDHTAQPRAKNRSMPPTKSSLQIKKEQLESNRIAESQTPRDGDVNTNHENESQIPAEQSEDRNDHGDTQVQDELPKANSAMMPETQDENNSATIVTETSTMTTTHTQTS